MKDTYRECDRKAPYKNIKVAVRAKNKNQWRSLSPLRVYRCSICRKYHLTSQKKRST